MAQNESEKVSWFRKNQRNVTIQKESEETMIYKESEESHDLEKIRGEVIIQLKNQRRLWFRKDQIGRYEKKRRDEEPGKGKRIK